MSIAAFLAVAVGLVTSSCTAEETTSTAGREVVVTDKGAEQPLTLASDQTLVLELAATPGTGYGWEVVKIEPPLLRRAPGAKNEPEYVCPDPPRPGAPCLQVLRFVGEGSGRTTLEVVYRRPWEKDEPASRTLRITVQTRGKFGG